MASIWPSTRCCRPQVTTCSTASKTLSQEVRNASAVSFLGQMARPAGQKQHAGFGESTFAIGPGDLLDDDRLAVAAIDAGRTMIRRPPAAAAVPAKPSRVTTRGTRHQRTTTMAEQRTSRSGAD